MEWDQVVWAFNIRPYETMHGRKGGVYQQEIETMTEDMMG